MHIKFPMNPLGLLSNFPGQIRHSPFGVSVQHSEDGKNCKNAEKPVYSSGTSSQILYPGSNAIVVPFCSSTNSHLLSNSDLIDLRDREVLCLSWISPLISAV